MEHSMRCGIKQNTIGIPDGVTIYLIFVWQQAFCPDAWPVGQKELRLFAYRGPFFPWAALWEEIE
jgi:hypothetical protein